MILVTCSCGYTFDIEDNQEFGYCPLCERDDVEIIKKENENGERLESD
jgi:Zn finger protein HypA/HybF involved in hydrogenase expression